ncbi:MAG: gliding-motility protein MglA [Anaerolineae bacterium]|nr:gliding-motility protein MglA [Anaerolineae bacterium]
MFINWKLREISLKIVYYGPALSGKTTNLQCIHAKTSPNIRGDLVSLNTRGDRTIYFDFLQIELGQIGGLKPRFNLYTVPGQIYYSGSRRLVLQGVDGVVFVADSQVHRLPANIETRRDMKENLTALGLDLFNIPVVLQCNKRDIPNVAPALAIKQQLGFGSVPCFESVALQGTGVFETLKAIINLVVAQTQQKLQ